MSGLQVIVFIVVVTYGLDRIVAIIFGIINYFDDTLIERLGASLQRSDPSRTRDAAADRSRGERLLYFSTSALFSLAVIWLSEYGIHITEEAIQLGPFESGEGNLLTNLDFWLTWLVLATGADHVTTLLGLSDPVGTIGKDQEPVVIEGILDLREELVEILEKMATKQP